MKKRYTSREDRIKANLAVGAVVLALLGLAVLIREAWVWLGR